MGIISLGLQTETCFMIAASELILNDRGAVYHLNLTPEELADTVITVGDPDRVATVSGFFDQVDLVRQHREFLTHTGMLQGRRISVVSTGIGTDNIDIVFNELDALVNIDLKTRQLRSEIRRLDIVRLGTCGGLQADLPRDALVVSEAAIGLDNLLHFYQHAQEPGASQLLQALNSVLPDLPVQPYGSFGDSTLLKRFRDPEYHHGITLTCPGFYGPQDRCLRAKPSLEGYLERLQDLRFESSRVLNFEMETSGMYGMGRLLGHRCLSISTVVANRISGSFSSRPAQAVGHMIERSLELLLGS